MIHFHRHSLKTRVTLFTLLIFVAGLWSLAFYASRTLHDAMQNQLAQQQRSTVALMADQFDDELRLRTKALEAAAIMIGPLAKGKPAALQASIEKGPIIPLLFNGGSYVVRPDGTAIASAPVSAGRLGLNYADQQHVLTALREGKSNISQVRIGKALKTPVFGIAVPIRTPHGDVVGALVGVIDLSQPNFLDHLVNSKYGENGGYLLVSPQQRMVITSSDKQRLMEALPAPGVLPAIDRFLQGFEGSAVLVNPLGQEVLVTSKTIPSAGWYVTVSLPTEEAFAPIRASLQKVLWAAFALTLLTGVLVWWLLQQQLAPLQSTARQLATLSAAKQKAQPLHISRPDEIGQLIASFNDLLLTLKEREDGLSRSEERYRTAFETSPDAININRLSDGLYLNVNDSFLKLMGWRRDEVVGKTSLELNVWRHPEDRQRLVEALQRDGFCRNLEADFVTRDGKIRTALMSAQVLTLDGEQAILSITRDISERKEAEQLIQSLAYSDPITNLPNRRHLIVRLQQAIASSERHQHQGALLLIDLDDFKALNDTLGHHQGDRMLEQVAKRLAQCVREGDTVARLGGDEFVVMLENLSAQAMEAAAQAEAVAQKILATLNQSYELNKSRHYGSASIGITLFGDHSETVDEPLIRADLALYQAKAGGRNTLRFFDPRMQVEIAARVALEAALRLAVQKNQFLLHYQAQIGAGQRITGVEALLRWQDPMHGMVSPADFIPVAEKTGLILPIGQWVLESACAQLALWAERPETAQLSLAVNVSERQFRQVDFVDQVLGAIERSGAPARRLKLELTESLLVANIDDVIRKMTALKERGVGFSLDDFGTGYSSLAYLKRLPLDQLKIDQGFVRDILIDPDDAAIARTVIALAHSLELGVIAEGVETEAQRDLLAQMGCHAYQGYLFGRPLPIAEFEALLTQHRLSLQT